MKKNVLIAGASGAIGKEFTKLYSDDPSVDKIITLSTKKNISSSREGMGGVRGGEGEGRRGRGREEG